MCVCVCVCVCVQTAEIVEYNTHPHKETDRKIERIYGLCMWP